MIYQKEFEKMGRCQQCGEWIPESEVDGIGAHCIAVDDGDGGCDPAPCGPVLFEEEIEEDK